MSDTPSLVELDPDEVADRLTAGSITLIDVREPEEYASGHIEGAILFPLSTFDPMALPVTDLPIVFQCGSGVRSVRAVEACFSLGLDHNQHMRGGIRAWRAAGLPTVA